MLNYKNGNGNDHNEYPQKQGFVSGLWKELKRILPRSGKAKVATTGSLQPQTEPGCRYHLNLARSDPSNRHHEVVTLMRNFPDMSAQSIEEIITIANDKGRALIRALSCKVNNVRDGMRFHKNGDLNPQQYTHVHSL